MAPSLKERYDQRQLQQLQERTKAADEQVIAENKFAVLLLEKMEETDLQKVDAIIQKLETLKNPQLPNLTQAIDQAQTDINKFTGGRPVSSGIWGKLKQKVGADNPVVKITTFADALERGFAQVPQILKNNGVNLGKFAQDDPRLSQSLQSLLTTQKTDEKEKTGVQGPGAVTGAKSDQEMGKSPFTGKNVEDNDKYKITGPEPTPPKAGGPAPVGKKTGGQDQRPKAGIAPRPVQKGSKAVEPTDKEKNNVAFNAKQLDWFKKGQSQGQELDEADPGASSSFDEKNKTERLTNIKAQLVKAFSPGGIFSAFKRAPYLNPAGLADELLKAPLKSFAAAAKTANSGAKAAEVAPDMKDQVQTAGDLQTKHTTGETPTQPTGQTKPTAPGKPTTEPVPSVAPGQEPRTAPPGVRGGGRARGGGGGEERGDRGAGPTPDKAVNFRQGLAKIYKGAGVDPETGQKLLKYLLSNQLVDRGTIESHGQAEQGQQKKTAAA